MTPRKPKKKLRKGEQVWWTIAHKGTPLATPDISYTRTGVLRSFFGNAQDYPLKELNALMKKWPNHKPVKIIVRLA